MSVTHIGIIREGKIPPDFRVPLSPAQCVQLEKVYPNVKVTVQASPIRCFADEAYTAIGIDVQEDLSHCDILLGVKEVPMAQLIAGKTYLFFSHTFKKQPYNRALLQAILHKRIRLIDYEVLKDAQNKRIIGFGRYAGVVGAYNAFLTYGLKSGAYSIKPAHLCADRKEVEAELKKWCCHLTLNWCLLATDALAMAPEKLSNCYPSKKWTQMSIFTNNTKKLFLHT
jgi:saccharopine dehydrogenase (NAD+, L-lysine-forming)